MTSPSDRLGDALLRSRRFFTQGTVSDDLRTLTHQGGREADDFYRDRWSHDKVVRSTHGVNCTGSCSWKVYVKDGIITWETQQTDYPSVGPDSPEYEPRGCPRGAAFSWYTYSPTRVRYPYVRGVLLQMYREAKSQHDGDPVKAWAHVVDHPQRAKAYKAARGKGGLVRASWDEATEMIAAAYVHTIRRWGPDRVAGFSPIPAMSMVSHASGARFTSLVGGSMLSFYDWYADLPVASPQVFGDQTDVPESGDWWDAGYLVMWGSNVPVTRTPDAHWMTEARYRGQKVVVVAPDYADNVKFADEWLRDRAGHRRRAGDVDGPRRAPGVLRRPGHALLRRLHEEVHRPAAPRGARRGGAGHLPARQVPDRRRPGDAPPRGERALQDRRDRRPQRRAGGAERRARPPVRRQRRRVLEPRPGRRRPRPVPAGHHPRLRARRAPALRQRRRQRRLADARGAGAAHRRPPGHHRLRPHAGAVRRGARRSAGPLADRVRRRHRAVHPGVAGGDHRRPRVGRGPDRARVRRQRRGVEGPLDDPHGGRDQPLVPLRHDLPRRSWP